MADLPRLLATLREVLRALDDLAAPSMLVGGVALAAWAPPRATVDLDLAISVKAADLPAVGAFIGRRVGGLSSMHPVRFRDGTTLQRVVVQRPEGEVTVDLVLAEGAFLEAAMRRRVRQAVGDLDLSVATPEDLVVMKLRAGRRQDLVDIRSLAEARRLDRGYVRRWAGRLKLMGRLARALPVRRGRRGSRR
ncbi:MAG: nucleotidyl transferase AbiEii/AbiGii toxin family protein [Deltaproteobacteria bacterium]|nr:nucleotidyl transferase AbiEii/AbiGii toxin family protein [Deltaproteobacteria bacterium]